MVTNKDSQPVILVFGRDGQIGQALQEAFHGLNQAVVFLGRTDCDLFDEVSIQEILHHHRPRVIINAAAYTAVDDAELNQEQAFAMNAKAPALMAKYIANLSQGLFLHYSSDYVFADTQVSAYKEVDLAGPMDLLNVYGQSKLLGEQAIQEAFAGENQISLMPISQGSRYYILRTSGVYGAGNNFIKTMLRLAQQQESLRVVTDQVGVPTSAQWLAQMALGMLNSDANSGIYHVVPDGEASWHEVAVFAIETAIATGAPIEMTKEHISPILSKDYAALAKRPQNSRLNHDKFKQVWVGMGLEKSYPSWQEQVSSYVRQLLKNTEQP